MSNEEQGIMQAQLAADRSRMAGGGGLQDRHAVGVSNLSERTSLYLGVIAFLGLLAVWATA